MNINQKTGLRIKTLRINKNLSQSVLASDADINRTYLNSVEKGVRRISIEALEKIIIALEINFKEFFNHPDFIND